MFFMCSRGMKHLEHGRTATTQTAHVLTPTHSGCLESLSKAFMRAEMCDRDMRTVQRDPLSDLSRLPVKTRSP